MGNLTDIIGSDWKASEHKQEFSVLKPGDYTVMVTNAKVADTKDGTGRYIKVELKTTDGRVVFANINIKNKNELATKIGQAQLAELCEACGLTSVEDTDQFVGQTIQVRLKVKRDDAYGDKNEVAKYMKYQIGSGVNADAGSIPF